MTERLCLSDILVTGVTGPNGAAIARHLIAAGADVCGLARDPAKRGFAPPQVQLVQGDFGDPDLLDFVLIGIKCVLLLSSVAPDQARLQNNLVAAAKRVGVPKIVKFSALGADPASSAALNRWHSETEHAIEASGLTYVHLRPNSLTQNLLRSADTIAQGFIAAPLADARVSYIDLEDVAAVAAIAIMTDRLDGQALDLTGPQAITYAETATKLSDALGRSIEYRPIDADSARAGMIGAGMPVETTLHKLATLFPTAAPEVINA